MICGQNRRGLAERKLAVRGDMRSFAVVLCVLTVGISAPACAEMEAKELLDLYQKSSVTVREEIESLVKKTETGFEWANADLTHNRKTIALYCSPEKKPRSQVRSFWTSCVATWSKIR